MKKNHDNCQQHLSTMKLLNRSFLRAALLILLVGDLLATGGCKHTEPEPLKNRPSVQPINSIRVFKFKCDNEITGEAVRNVFVEILARYGDVKVVTEGDADVVIDGTVTIGKGSSSGSGITGTGAFVVGKSHSVGGDYVSGVTALVVRRGEIITSSSWGQTLKKGEDLFPPEIVARRAADGLLRVMSREGLKRR